MLIGAGITVSLNWEELVWHFKLGEKFKYLGLNDQGYREFLHRDTEIVMVLLPGGEFLMGSPEDEFWRWDSENQHSVKLSPFMIAKYEVSQTIWRKVMKENSSKYKEGRRPVEMVSWEDLNEIPGSFCEKTGLSLPTEAQWEYACRGGTQTAYSFGDIISTLEVNYSSYSIQKTEETGTFRNATFPVNFGHPNPFGLYNMHGNVWEWCLDVFYKEYYLKNEAQNGDLPSTKRKPVMGRVIRGGSWMEHMEECRSARRGSVFANTRDSHIGFRPVYIFPYSL